MRTFCDPTLGEDAASGAGSVSGESCKISGAHVHRPPLTEGGREGPQYLSILTWNPTQVSPNVELEVLKKKTPKALLNLADSVCFPTDELGRLERSP